MAIKPKQFRDSPEACAQQARAANVVGASRPARQAGPFMESDLCSPIEPERQQTTANLLVDMQSYMSELAERIRELDSLLVTVTGRPYPEPDNSPYTPWVPSPLNDELAARIMNVQSMTDQVKSLYARVQHALG